MLTVFLKLSNLFYLSLYFTSSPFLAQLMVGFGFPTASQWSSTLSVPLARTTVCPRWVTTSEAESCCAAEIFRRMAGFWWGLRNLFVMSMEVGRSASADDVLRELVNPETRLWKGYSTEVESTLRLDALRTDSWCSKWLLKMSWASCTTSCSV